MNERFVRNHDPFQRRTRSDGELGKVDAGETADRNGTEY